MISLHINGKHYEAHEEETLLSVIRRAGISVPTLCRMEDMTPSGACRMCVVEVEGNPGLVPSCSYPAADGMKIHTHSPKALEARKTIIELLLANHPDDCLYCDRNGTCELQSLAREYNVTGRRYQGSKNQYNMDITSPSIVRDPGKCILCGRCVRVCEEIQGVAAIDFINRGSRMIVGTAFNQSLNVSSCINCGQCIIACPTGALREKSHIEIVMDALDDQDKILIVQHAPAISVSIAEELNMDPGIDMHPLMTAALRKIGFDYVFDTSFTADLTVMEEGSELVDRIKNDGVLPMLTSCSPGWIKYVEQYYPDFIPNLSTCKSPQQMLGALTKSYFAEMKNIDPERIFSVSVMPCTAKKFEMGREELMYKGLADIDAVLTTRELGKLIRMFNINISSLSPETDDVPFGTRSSAGKLFGGTGGVMEAAIRTAYYILTGEELKQFQVTPVRGLAGIKEAQIKIGDIELGVAVASTLKNAGKLLEQIKQGRDDLHFIEVMTCPGGCIAGGGQPFGADINAIKSRLQALYQIDQSETLKVSHQNAAVGELYKNYLDKPLSHRSHELLHTSYRARKVMK